MRRNLMLLKLFGLASSLTFSGGLAMLPMLHQQLVEEAGFLSSDEFYHYTALAQSIPGVTVVTTASLLGAKVNGRSGRFFACLGAILPVLVIMTFLTMVYQQLPKSGLTFYVLTAIRGTAGIFIIEASYEMARQIIKGRWQGLLFTFIVVMALVVFRIPSSFIILVCLGLAVFSIVTGRTLG